ncbi:MAG: hypothetical protein R2749_13010 [Acidimicrobiales bacterium]
MNDSFDPTGTSWCGVSFETDPPAIAVRERVRLADTDSSGLIYYGAVTPWLSRAHAELVLALGFRQTSLVPTPMLPVVNVELTYHDRLALGDAYVLRGWVSAPGPAASPWPTRSAATAPGERRMRPTCTSTRPPCGRRRCPTRWWPPPGIGAGRAQRSPPAGSVGHATADSRGIGGHALRCELLHAELRGLGPLRGPGV